MSAAKADYRPAAPQDDCYLPDLCAARPVLAVVLIAELVALVLALARHGPYLVLWADLAKSSLFLLWIGLCSAGTLCFARPHLARLSVLWASLASFVLLVAVTGLISEAALGASPAWNVDKLRTCVVCSPSVTCRRK